MDWFLYDNGLHHERVQKMIFVLDGHFREGGMNFARFSFWKQHFVFQLSLSVA